jgi:hypothetical protein
MAFAAGTETRARHAVPLHSNDAANGASGPALPPRTVRTKAAAGDSQRGPTVRKRRERWGTRSCRVVGFGS